MKKINRFSAGLLAVVLYFTGYTASGWAENTDYSDYIPGEIPENLITSSGIITQQNGGTTFKNDNTAMEVSYTNNKTTAGEDMYVFNGSMFTAKNGGGHSISIDNYKANTTYVYKTKVKNATADAVLGNPYYGIAYVTTYGYNNGTGSNEYGKTGMEVTSRDWMDFKATITYPANWDEASTKNYAQALHVGTAHRKSPAGSTIIASSNLNDMYLAEEVAYDLTINAETNQVDCENPIEIKAEAVNQIGIAGTLDRNINWIALNSDRTAVIEKIHITETTENTAQISVDTDTEYGKYIILAQSEVYQGFQKGFEIEVGKPPLKDYIAGTKPENLIRHPENSKFATKSSNNVSVTTIENSGYSTIEALTDIQSIEGLKVYTIMSNGIDPDYNFIPGETYAVSAKVRNPEPDTEAYFNMFISNNTEETLSLTNEYGAEGMKLTEEWQEFKASIKVSQNYDTTSKNKIFTLGLNSGTKQGAKADVELSVYIQEEVPLDIMLKADNTASLGVDERLNINAEVVNQIGVKGTSKQGFNWFILDEERKEEKDGLTLEISEDTQTAIVSTDIFTEAGVYYVGARSKDYNDFVKMIKVEVDKPSAEECVIEFIKTADKAELEDKLPSYISALEINADMSAVNYTTLAELIVNSRDDNVADYALFTEKAVAIALYETLSNVSDSNGNFTYDKALNLKALDKNGVTVYDIFTNGITDKGKNALQSELKGVYNNFEEFEKKFSELVILNVIENPNKSGTGFIAEILTKENAAAAGINVNEFLSLSDKTKASKYIMNKTFTKSELEQAIAGIEATIKNNETTNKPSSSGNSGGSSYSGGSNIVVAPSVSVEKEENKNDEQNNQAVNISIKLFDDVTEEHWAYSDIYYLKRIDVLSGVSEKEFMPEGLLTREQFVKLLCTALKYELSDEECIFDDAVKGSWYEKYIVTAFKKGIINGIGDTVFGIGKSVTREDMCVMITRALGTDLTGEFDNSFTDSEEISEYALNSVSYLASVGVIKGFDDGSFKPKEFCTRAQAAKIICTILNMEGVL